MVTDFIFNEIVKFEPGIISDLLFKSYAEILDEDLQEQFLQFDREVFEKPETIGACTFITTLGREIIGMASYDPRQAPELGIIGHNCILPENQGYGYGKLQILETIRRLKFRHVDRIVAMTSEHPFFRPACRMYLSCGFYEVKRNRKQPQDAYKTICFELNLTR